MGLEPVNPEAAAEDARMLGRIWWICLLMGAAFTLLSGRLAVLQLSRHEELAAKARDYRVRKEPLPARRGTILDRNGEVLARHQTVYTLSVDKYHLADHKLAVAGLSVALDLPAAEIRRSFSREELLERYRTHVGEVVGPNLSDPGRITRILAKPGLGVAVLGKGFAKDVKEPLEAEFAERGVRGVYFEEAERRYYPEPLRAAHVLGYVDAANTGKEGVERTLDPALRGAAGWRQIERDSLGRELAAYRKEQEPPEDGHVVRLTIDLGLQCMVEELMDLAEHQFQPAKMSVIFLDPRSGEILALANRPSFNLQTREGARRNIAVSDQYEPGSTFKIVTAAAALDLGVMDLESRVFCHYGELNEGRMAVRDEGSYGDLSLRMILAKSSNIGIYKVARRLEPDQLNRYIGYFGFGKPTGIRLSAESAGRIGPARDWSGSSLSRIAMGYEVGVTALQVANAFAAVANGGVLLTPRIVRSVETSEGTVLQATGREFVRRVISVEAAAALRDALVSVVAPGGSGRLAAVDGYTVAGKTGTAQRYDEAAGGYVEGSAVVSFAGFLPAAQPRLAGIVVIHDPQVSDGERYGGVIAAPLFGEMARRAVAYLDIPPERSPVADPNRAAHSRPWN